MNDQPKPENECKAALNASEAASCVNDPEYERFALAYERNIGSMPTGKSLQVLDSYYDDFGADIMIMAVEEANLAGASQNSHPLVLKILKTWQDAGVDSVEKAKREIEKHANKKAVEKPQEPQPVSVEKVNWIR